MMREKLTILRCVLRCVCAEFALSFETFLRKSAKKALQGENDYPKHY